MTPVGFILIFYGALIVLVDSYGIWRPRLWIEWTERQLVYRRVRWIVGIICVLLGAIPLYWLIDAGSWSLLIIVSAIWIIIGLLILSFADTIRQLILTFGELDDKILRILFAVDAAFGVLLILLGVF